MPAPWRCGFRWNEKLNREGRQDASEIMLEQSPSNHLRASDLILKLYLLCVVCGRFDTINWFMTLLRLPLPCRKTDPLPAWSAICSPCGLHIGLLKAPTDFQQGDSYRIIFIHVPASILSMFIYLIMAGYAALGLIFNTRLSSMMAQALAPTGALFAFISLWTGALWGKPMWGAWWVWDARLTSELILLFLYLGFIALQASIEDPRRADKAAALLAIVGSVNVPIIYFSVKWWNTLHQGATIKMTGTSMHVAMQQAMFIVLVACWLYVIAVALARVRSIILERERNTQWVSELKEVRS
jgi:heme exporter protein C